MCCHVGQLCDCAGILQAQHMRQPRGSLLQFIVGGRGSRSATEGARVIPKDRQFLCQK